MASAPFILKVGGGSWSSWERWCWWWCCWSCVVDVESDGPTGRSRRRLLSRTMDRGGRSCHVVAGCGDERGSGGVASTVPDPVEGDSSSSVP